MPAAFAAASRALVGCLVARVWALLHLPCALARPLLLACSLLLLLLLLLGRLGWLALAL